MIQGTAASMMKLAGNYVLDYILDNDLFGVVKICSFIHDELVVECPEDMVDTIGTLVKESMENAANVFCKSMTIAANPVITKYWKK